MKLLPGHSGPENGNGEHGGGAFAENGSGLRSYVAPGADEGGYKAKIDPLDLLRRYWLLLISLLLLGLSAGFASVVLSSPKYRSRLVLEIQGAGENQAKSTIDTIPFDATEVGIQTQINILRSVSFLRRGVERMQSESVPLAPSGGDLFSRLRQRVNPATSDPMETTQKGLSVAVGSFDARPVNRTKLIELTCESTSPDVAAQFLNAMGNEFVEYTLRSRMQTAQKTSEWLSAQIEETRSKLLEAEEKQRDFVQASGNLFAGQDSTLEDSKLGLLKTELAKIQAERIGRQTRYELVLKTPPERLAEVLDNGDLRAYQQQIVTLKQEKASLEITYTPAYDKVRKLDTRIALLQKTYDDQVATITERIKDDYNASLRHEKLLAANYAAQSQRVSSEAGKASQNNSLKREAEMLRLTYQNLLMQANQVGIGGSAPVNPVRVVEAAAVPDSPFKPVPLLNISFGGLLGLVICAGIVFLRQNTDRSINPTLTRYLLTTPELGVIPNLRLGAGRSRRSGLAKLIPGGSFFNGDGAPGEYSHPEAAMESLVNAPPFVAESFRSTLASILRNQTNGKIAKTILITSPGPGEGKTTVVQHLGIALAETGRKVLLIDADFRRPYLHRRFGLRNDRSLMDMLAEDRPVHEYRSEEVGVSTGLPGLSILPNRPVRENVAKMLYSPRLRDIFEILVEQYDMVLVDAPPVLNLADTRIVAPLTDAVILVLRAGVTARDAVTEACQRIQEDGLFLLGTVLTDCDAGTASNRDYYYNYVSHDAE